MVGVGFVLVELEGALDLLDGHDETDDGPRHVLDPAGRHLAGLPHRLGRRAWPSKCSLNSSRWAMSSGPDSSLHRAAEMDALIEPGRHLMRRGIPVRRHIGVGAGDGRAATACGRRRARPAYCRARRGSSRAACRLSHSSSETAADDAVRGWAPSQHAATTSPNPRACAKARHAARSIWKGGLEYIAGSCCGAAEDQSALRGGETSCRRVVSGGTGDGRNA